MSLKLNSDASSLLDSSIKKMKEAASKNENKCINESVTYTYYDKQLKNYYSCSFYVFASAENNDDKIRIDVRLSMDINKTVRELKSHDWIEESENKITNGVNKIIDSNFEIKENKEELEILSLTSGGPPKFNVKSKSKGSKTHTAISYYGESSIPFKD